MLQEQWLACPQGLRSRVHIPSGIWPIRGEAIAQEAMINTTQIATLGVIFISYSLILYEYERESVVQYIITRPAYLSLRGLPHYRQLFFHLSPADADETWGGNPVVLVGGKGKSVLPNSMPCFVFSMVIITQYVNSPAIGVSAFLLLASTCRIILAISLLTIGLLIYPPIPASSA